MLFTGVFVKLLLGKIIVFLTQTVPLTENGLYKHLLNAWTKAKSAEGICLTFKMVGIIGNFHKW